MKIDRKKIGNRCGYDQNECMLLAKRLAACADDEFLQELQKIKVWNYGKCELGLWVDILDRLDGILEDVSTKVGLWTLKVDLPGNEHLVKNVVTVLEFTGHLIEHSIYRCLYGSWNHILTLFGSSNMDILLAVLGLAYNFSKRSNYFTRLDPANKKMILDRLVSIAETWGGSENQFDFASCCKPDHFPLTAGNIYFEYRPEEDLNGDKSNAQQSATSVTGPNIIVENLKNCDKTPSDVMESLLTKHSIPSSKQMALFARIRLAIYFSNQEKRVKCIRARLQAISTLCYTFEIDDRLLYPGLMDELVEILQLPDGKFMEIKACALRTMTAVFNLHRVNVNLVSILESTGMSSFHGALPTRIRRWIQSLVDGTCDASGGSVNQQYTIALLSFLYHLASFEENVGPGSRQNHATTMSTSGILESMLQLIAWHVPRNDCLSYVTRAVRVTDQILMSAATNRQTVVSRLVDRLGYEVSLVLSSQVSKDEKTASPAVQALMLNTQRSGLMKSMLNLLKRLCLDTDWNDAIRAAMESNLPNILCSIYRNSVFHFTPHLALFAMETITNYIYTYPSRISYMQDNGITCDILRALTEQPLPQNRDFLVHLPSILITLALNTRGRSALCISGILDKYLETLVSPDYLTTMKAKRVRDFLSQISYNLSSTAGQVLSNNLTASQMSNSIQELLRSHSELKPTVFSSLVKCFKKVVELGQSRQASLIPSPESLSSVENAVSSAVTEGSACSPCSGDSHYTTYGRTGSSSSSRARSGAITTSSSVNRNRRLTITSAAVIDGGAPSGRLAPDEGNLVMLSGSDDNGSDNDADDDDDIDDVNLTVSRAAAASNDEGRQTMTLAAELELVSPSITNMAVLNSLDPVDSFQHLADYTLNLCKFLECLLPTMMHVTEGMCRQFLNQDGVQVLCDLLTMPGLPYDFPVSAACASLCKIFEQLVSYLTLPEVLKPVLLALETSISKANKIRSLSSGSFLYAEYSAGRTELLHELVSISSILCVLVHIVNHLKSELRSSFTDSWMQKNLFPELGELYMSVSWEAAVLLNVISGEGSLGIVEETANASGASAMDQSQTGLQPTTSGSSSSTSKRSSTNSMPSFVEALSIYRILRPDTGQSSSTTEETVFAANNPELKNTVHHIVYVTSFLINSVTELCTTMTRFCAITPQHHRRLIMPVASFDPISLPIKFSLLSRIARFSIGALLWVPPSTSATADTKNQNDRLIHAMRFSAIRLAHLLLFDANKKTPQVLMLNVFYMLAGIDSLFDAFNDVMKWDLTNEKTSETVTAVIEEWFACADRLSNTDSLKLEIKKSVATEVHDFDVTKFTDYVNRSSLQPLELLCCRSGFVNLLSHKAVEHLLNLLINVVPFIFSENETDNDDGQTDDENITPKTAVDSDADVEALTSKTAISNSSTTVANHMHDTVRILEDMGFQTQLAEMALEETNGSVAEAVNFLLLSSVNEFDLGNNANRSITDSVTIESTISGVSKIPARAAIEQVFESLIPTMNLEHFNDQSKRKQNHPKPKKNRKMRESLKKNLFTACYKIARLHKTYEVLHQISELMLSSKQESQCIEELVAAAASNLITSMGIMVPTRPLPSVDVEVGLHLITLLFTRCRFLCAQMAHKYALPSLLCALITGDVMGLFSYSLPSLLLKCEPGRPFEGVLECGEKQLMLAALILDHYERTVRAIQLRKKAMGLYENCHSWSWFDEQAMLWHPQVRESFQIVDVAFHNGATRAQCSVDRRRYAIDFPTMTQVNLDGMHRRPVLLMPCSPSGCNPSAPSEEGMPAVTEYEHSMSSMEVPIGLHPDQRKGLCQALLKRLTVVPCEEIKPEGLSAFCIDSFLRLLLRFSSSSFDDVKTLIDGDILEVLFNFPHPADFAEHYSIFVGHILRQVFDDETTVSGILKKVIIKMAQGLIPSLYNNCHDLFYIIGLCVPLLAKNEELALKLMKDVFTLSIDDKSIEDGVLPKSFTVKSPSDEPKLTDGTTSNNQEPNDCQKRIVIFVIEALVKQQTPVKLVGSTAETSTKDDCANCEDSTLPNANENKIISFVTDKHSELLSNTSDKHVCLSKLDYLRYLVDLSMASPAVAEFVSKYHLTDSQRPTTSFISYLFTHELCDMVTTDLTVLLLETLVFTTNQSTQSSIMTEFKISLRDITVVEASTNANQPGRFNAGQLKNQRIISHMRFLECLLILPPPTVTHIVKQVYKRQIPCDIAKLLALVNCNVANTQQTLTVLVKGLENLTWIDRQLNKRLISDDLHQTRSRLALETLDGVQHSYVSGLSTVADDMHSVAETTQPLASVLAPSIVPEPVLVDLAVGSSQNATQITQSTSVPTDVAATSATVSAPGNENVRIDQMFRDLSDITRLERSEEMWTLSENVSDQEDDGQEDDDETTDENNAMLILDDEDEGSAGQGAETDNSQDEENHHEQRISDSYADGYALIAEDGEGSHIFPTDSQVNAVRDHGEDDEEDEEEEDGVIDNDDDDDDDDDLDDDGSVYDRVGDVQEGEFDALRTAFLAADGFGGGSPQYQPPSRSESTNLMAALVSDVLNIVDVPRNLVPNDRNSTQRDQLYRDRDRFLLQFATVGGNSSGGGADRADVADSHHPLHEIGADVVYNLAGHMTRAFDYINPTHANVGGGSGGRLVGLLNTASSHDGHYVNEPIVFGNNSIGGHSSVGSSISHNPPHNLPSQHPLLQVPHSSMAVTTDVALLRSIGSSAPGANASSNITTSRHSRYMNTFSSWAGGSGNGSISRNNQPNVNRDGPVISILLPPSRLAVNGGVSSSNTIGGDFNRGGNSAATPIVVRTNLSGAGTSGVGSSGRMNYASAAQTGVNAPQFNAYNLHAYEGSLINPRSSRRRGTGINQVARMHRPPPPSQPSSVNQSLTHQSEQEADSLVWDMFASLSEYQASAITTSFTMAVDTRESTSCNLYSTLNNFLRLIDLARILYGQEVMDMILVSRHEVGVEALRRRYAEFRKRLDEHEQQKAQQTEQNQEQLEENSSNPNVTPQDAVLDPVISAVRMPVGETNDTTMLMSPVERNSEPYYFMGWNRDGETSQNAPTVSQPTQENAALTESAPLLEEVVLSWSEMNVDTPFWPTTAETGSLVEEFTEAEDPTPVPSTTPEPATMPSASEPAPPTEPVPVTDEETIASMVAEGMDPSFLDALPEEMRRELMADHRRTRQLRSQISSMQLPDHLSADFISSLPPNLQEEVLAQVRQEIQRQTPATSEVAASVAEEDGSSAATMVISSTAGRSRLATNTTNSAPVHPPENNTAFLASLPQSLRREVLADMEDFQIDLLSTDLQSEARGLRREHDEQFARTVRGRILPALFRPRNERSSFAVRWDSRINNYHRLMRNGASIVVNNLGPTTITSLQSFFAGRNRYLIDHEGLTCIIAMIVASSSCPILRRQTIPVLKSVLRNLSSHPPTRNWIICTILSILKNLSEKPLPATSSGMVMPTSSANSIFAMGFEAALGCWIRIFHPQIQHSTYLASRTENHQQLEEDTSSSSVSYIIHPQAANPVCATLLDATADLARASPHQFFPVLLSRDAGKSNEIDMPEVERDFVEPRTDFWEILARLSVSPPSLFTSGVGDASKIVCGPTSSVGGGHRLGHTRKSRNSASGSTSPGRRFKPPPSRPSDRSCTEGGESSNIPIHRGGRNRVVAATEETGERLPSIDYFSHVAGMLCHPVVSCRPALQEKLLSILVGVVRAFFELHRLQLTAPNPTSSHFPVPPTSGEPILSSSIQTPLPSTSMDTSAPTSIVLSTDSLNTLPLHLSPVIDLMRTLQPSVTECLCDLIVARKSTEQARSDAIWLVMLISRINSATKAFALKLLRSAAAELTKTITEQLKAVINEVNSLSPSNKPSGPSTSKILQPSSSMIRLSTSNSSNNNNEPSTSSANSSNILPNRFGEPGSVIVVSNSLKEQSPTGELELTSLLPLATARSEQSRLCCLLRLILNLVSASPSDVASASSKEIESIDGLSELWENLSLTLDCLQGTTDVNTVLLLIPLVESLCLTHSSVIRENLMFHRTLRNPPTGSSASSSSAAMDAFQFQSNPFEFSSSVGSSSIFGSLLPSAPSVIEPLAPVSPNQTSDLNRPMSPPPFCSTSSHNTSIEDNSATSENSPVFRFAEAHRTSLNHILRNFTGNLSDSSFVAFLAYPRMLDFDIKRRFFRQRLQVIANRTGPVSRFEDEPVVVSRERIFEDSYARLHRKSAADWKHKFVIRFQNEEGQDAGGLLREWYLLMSREIFNPNYCLFRVSPADRVTYTINPSSFINSNHLSYFKFVGRFIAKAIYDNKLLECYFTRSFYKHMLGIRVRFADLENEDFDFFKGLEYLLKHDVNELGYDVTFSTEINEFGKNETRDLIENGRNIIVTEANKHEYVRLVCQERLTGAIRTQLDAFLEGFYEIIPKSLINIFNEQELELLISGLPNIDIDDLKANTTYSKYQSTSTQVEWFWQALESFDHEDRARFLQFLTGTSKVPLGGFANLEGMHGPTKFQISRAVVSSTSHLPSAHTCFNTLELPPYDSYEQLRERLLTAIRECSEGYGMA